MTTDERTRSRDAVRAYVKSQIPEDPVHHLERVSVEHVAGQRHEIWDVHLESGERWWAVTNPTNLYPQADFKSRDVVLTFHVGLSTRIATRHQVPISEGARLIFDAVWQRWEQGAEALSSAEEAEQFQAVGTHLRGTLISLGHEIAHEKLVPEGGELPKASDVVAWVELFVRALTPGKASSRLRHYVISMVKPTWDYQQHLLHNKNATRMDAEIGLASVAHLTSTLTALVIRCNARAARCGACDADAMGGGSCRRCGWQDPAYEPPELPVRSRAEIRAALAEPCTLSSDIQTLLTVDVALAGDAGR